MYGLSITELVKKGQSYYSLVLAVAKRARDIVEDANDNGEQLTEKPVSQAIEEFSKGIYKYHVPQKKLKECEVESETFGE
ncbi:MAG: DNA-directed RNA polymerase subunit omega [Oscillospiraceae bacterium]|nr:DNA-directed RNA polymerase subunit omega [Oscillospiraceae bacterium]